MISQTDLLVLLFPAVFMFHDFEEIILLKPWLGRHLPALQAHFPFLAGQRFARMAGWSPGAFAAAVCEEFLVVCIVSFLAVVSGWYALWFGLLTAFTLHLLVHMLQAVVLRRYVPALATSFIVLPYCVYALTFTMGQEIFTGPQAVLWSAVRIAAAGVNLWLAHHLAEAFSRWERRQ